MFRSVKRILIISILAAFVFTLQTNGASMPKGWEPVKSEYTDAKSVVKEPEIEILTAQSTVIVNTSRPVKIQIFTILGRLVSSETLPSGVSQLTINAHGVYIVKVGELTCKIAI